jgi:hypothetical protein
MNKRDQNEARLLADTLHPDWDAIGGSAARAAARSARRHRRMRVVGVGAGVVAAVAVLAMALSRTQGHVPVSPRPVAAVTASATPRHSPGYEVISDDELLSALKDQPVLVVKQPNGTREIVLLAN